LNRQDIPAKQELLKVLKKNIKKFKPSFEPILGFHYKEIEGYPSLEEQLQFLESLEKIGILNNKATDTVLICSFCKSHSFALRLACTQCRSSNVVLGTIIQHDVCGNVDFDYKYIASESKMVCGKCNKSLKAIGVDYSKQGDIYRCSECKAVLPNIDKQYMCLKCGETSLENEMDLMKLQTFTVNTQKLVEYLNNNNNPIISIMEELSNVGIKSGISDSVVGMSQIHHTFDLVVYDSKNIPILIMDMIEPSHYSEKEETQVLSFIAKSIDTNIQNKIILAIPSLKKNLKTLINLNGINLIESLIKEDVIFKVTHSIAQICDGAVNVNYT
jgi:TackOD1 domain-containing protein